MDARVAYNKLSDPIFLSVDQLFPNFVLYNDKKTKKICPWGVTNISLSVLLSCEGSILKMGVGKANIFSFSSRPFLHQGERQNFT